MLTRIRSQQHHRTAPTLIRMKITWAIAAILLVAGLVPPVHGQDDPIPKPPTQELLPETTVAFVQIDNFRDMMEKMRESSMGKLMQDEAVAPLVEGLWDEARMAYADVEDKVGVSFDDIQALPSGEMTFAVIAPRRQNPEFMMIIQLDEDSEAVDRVLERGRELITQEGGQEITKEESDDGIEFESFVVDGKTIKFFQKDGWMVGSSSPEELDAFIDRWFGREVEKVRPLSQNRKFVTIMNRCLGSNELKPEARFFVDPINFAKSQTRGDIGAQIAINMLPVLGLDGLLGVGGSMILSEDEFESLVHAHVLLANPRKGVFEMIAFKPTDYKPEPWLPLDTATYMTTSWDVEQMLTELSTMIDTVQGEEDVVDLWFEDNLNKELELDVKEDILAHLSGRITYAEWISEPIQLNSQVQIFALGLKDAEAFEESLDVVIERINRDEEEERMVEGEYKGFRTWTVNTGIERQMERRRQRRIERGEDVDGLEFETEMQPRPVVALVGDYLLMSFSSRSMQFIEHAIDTFEGDFESLVDDEKYYTVSQKMNRMLKTDMPCGISYQNPEHAFKLLFELAKSEETQSFITRQTEGNKYVAGFQQRMRDNPLPDFDDVKKYFRPSGGFAVSDDTGYHFLAFSLREQEDDE